MFLPLGNISLCKYLEYISSTTAYLLDITATSMQPPSHYCKGCQQCSYSWKHNTLAYLICYLHYSWVKVSTLSANIVNVTKLITNKFMFEQYTVCIVNFSNKNKSHGGTCVEYQHNMVHTCLHKITTTQLPYVPTPLPYFLSPPEHNCYILIHHWPVLHHCHILVHSPLEHHCHMFIHYCNNINICLFTTATPLPYVHSPL